MDKKEEAPQGGTCEAINNEKISNKNYSKKLLKVKVDTYNVFHPTLCGFLLGRLDGNLKELKIDRSMHGSALPEGALETIASQIERGIAKEEVLTWLVAPAEGHPKKRDCFTLSEFVRKLTEGEPIKYTHKTKVEWTSDRVRNQVKDSLSKGKSLAHIARHLGVSKSTLTKANKRHGYRLYIPKGELV